MATIAQRFFHSTTEQDFTATGEVDIRKLLESAPGTDSTTICTHANAAGTTQITLDPYTNRSTVGDIRANAGWAINRLGTDGMVSTATENRIIAAGTWTVVMFVSIPAAGTLTGTLTVSNIYQIFRVSSSGARTAIGSTFTSNTVTSAALAAANSGVLTATINPGLITLAADETIHIGAISNMVQVAGTLGATVAGVATYRVGTSAEYVEVATPGVRTNYIRTLTTVVGVGTVTRQFSATKTASLVGVGTPTSSKVTVASKTFNLVGVGTPTFTKVVVAVRAFSLVGVGTVTRQLSITQPRNLTGVGTPTFSRVVVAAKTFSLIGVGAVTSTKTIQMSRSLIGVGTVTNIHPVQAYRTFNLTGVGTILVNGTNGTTITLPIDEVPEVGGGGTTIIKKPIYIFDD